MIETLWKKFDTLKFGVPELYAEKPSLNNLIAFNGQLEGVEKEIMEIMKRLEAVAGPLVSESADCSNGIPPILSCLHQLRIGLRSLLIHCDDLGAAPREALATVLADTGRIHEALAAARAAMRSADAGGGCPQLYARLAVQVANTPDPHA
ncbi:hypothetical protein [Desulfobacter vibrioformis]|uniref:hypothetical protein n=1 Tax=Desulfobacter vibrioformis TaxID=34031 RepID=UPI00054E13B1|nr:hypothetical protein [Desulfobacter vibrioformis]